MVKGVGPSTVPCRTPQERGCGGDFAPSTDTYSDQSERKDSFQAKEVSLMPRQWLRRERTVE